MSTPYSSNLAQLPPPSVEATLNVLTHWSGRFGPDYTGFVASVASSLRYGLHALPWYLRWLMFHQSASREAVLFHRNEIASSRYLELFAHWLDPEVCERYHYLVTKPNGPDPLDSYPILVYDHLLRAEKRSEASQWLSRRTTRLAGEFLGLPFVRCVLSPETETNLWTLANSRCAPCSQP